MSLRIIMSGLTEPHWSAALDHALLDGVRSKEPVLHVYRRPPTISLGYSRSVSEIDLEQAEKEKVTIIRRMSGGGSIYNDEGQLIYSLAVPAAIVPKERKACLHMACSIVAEAIRSLGVKAEIKEPNDVLVNGTKVSGNSQIRREGSVALQGTLIVFHSESNALLNKSSTTGSLASVRDISIEEAERALVKAVGRALKEDLRYDRPDAEELERARDLLRERYGNKAFIWKR
ncbi:MAG TPA: lipoate--protein ligase family protein [Candidatus Methanomethylophilaceae archaeon]|nr:lipoate--protein ligase family protein [Candidatus Methanomethylophilaceae archaeon]